MEADAEGQVEGGDHQQSPEALEEQGDQAHLEHVGVEHHQQNDDHVEQGGNILDDEEHELNDRRSPKEFTERVDEEVIGQQAQLNQQHQGIVASLKHGGLR